MKSPLLVICISHLCGCPASSSCSMSLLNSPPFPLLFPCSHQGDGMAHGVSDCELNGGINYCALSIRLFCPAANYQKICRSLLCLSSLSICQICLKWARSFYDFWGSVEIQYSCRSLISLEKPLKNHLKMK